MNERFSYALAIILTIACALRLLHIPTVSAAEMQNTDVAVRGEFVIAIGRSPRSPTPEIRHVLENLALQPGPARSEAVWALCRHCEEKSTILALREVLQDDGATPIERGSAAMALARVVPADIELRLEIEALVTTEDAVLRLFLTAARSRLE